MKAERERQGTTLAAIAEKTKIKASLLGALERGDVSKWPKGIYRRAFFRDYLSAIGLSPDQHLGELLELFADGEELPAAIAPPLPLIPASSTAHAPSPSGLVTSGMASMLRLTFAEASASRLLGALPRRGAPLGLNGRYALSALLDVVAVLGLALFASLWTPDRWAAVAVAGAAYYLISTAVLGRSLAAWWLTNRIPAAPPMPVQAAEPIGVMAKPATAAAAENLRVLVGHAVRGQSAVREYVIRLARTSREQRKRELESIRRRRVEAINRAEAEDVSAALRAHRANSRYDAGRYELRT